MSATICLYKLSEAKFQNKGLYSIPHQKCREMTDSEFEALWETKDSDRFDDHLPHVLVDLTYFHQCYGHSRGWKRVREKFNKLPVHTDIVDGSGNIHSFIVADLVAEYSGRCLNNRYYKKDCWLVLCTTKEEVSICFKKYGTKDHKVVLDSLLDKWESGKTFLIITY